MSALLFIACSRPSENLDKGEKITIDASAIKEIKLSSENSTRIVLENNADGIIAEVKKLYIHDSIFYIHSLQKMSMFNFDGSFHGNISSKGRAANEYLTLWYSWITDSDLFMYDLNSNKIMQYNFKNKTINNLELPDTKRFQAVIPLGNKGFIAKLSFMGSENSCPELGFYNKEYKFIRELGPLKLNSGLWLGYPFYIFGNEVLYWRHLGQDIYSVDHDLNFTIKYTLDFQGKNIPMIDFEDDYAKIDFINRTPEKYISSLFDVEETDKYLFFVFIYDKTKNIAVYSKKKKELNLYKFTFDGTESLNTVIPYKDKIIVVSDIETGNSIIYIFSPNENHI